MALLWVRPLAILEVLKDDDVPLPTSVVYGLVCGLIGAVFPWFGGAWSTGFTALMVLAATVAPLIFGALLWGASELFGSKTSTWTQSVALAAALLGVFPVASFFQFLAAKAALGIFGGVVLPVLYFVVLTAMGFVITLEANPLAGAGFGTLGVLVVLGGGIVQWKAAHPLVPPKEEVVLAEPVAPAPPPEVEKAKAAAPEPPSTTWTVKLQSVPPGAEVVEVLNGRPRGPTPLTLEFPASVERVQVQLKLGASQTLQMLEQHGESFVVVVMPH